MFFSEVKLLNESGIESTEFVTGDTMVLELRYKCDKPNVKANFVACITRSDWVFCYGTSCKYQYEGLIDVNKEGKIILKMKNVGLLKNSYYFDLTIKDEEDNIYDNIYCLIPFKIVESKKKDVGVLTIDTQWTM